jgi:hypothetical protein
MIKERKDLFCAPSLYSLFLYTLINEDWTKSDFVLSRIPHVIYDNLRNLFGCYVYPIPERYGKTISHLVLLNLDYWRFTKAFGNRKYERVWGNDEFLYRYRNQGMILVEDGAYNSYSKEITYRRQLHNDLMHLNYYFYWIFKGYISYGWSKKVKQIYHTTAIELPKEIAHKGVQFDLDEKWRGLSQNRKKEIFDLFSLKEEFVNKLNEYSTVLVTQDLPIPDEEKISIYKKMTEGVDMSKVLIKTHYAEKTDYSKVFPESTVISMPVPMQLFSLLGYNPTKVMTISSGAVGPFIKEGVEVIFLGTEIDPRIAAVYGVITKETYMSKLNNK